MLLCWYVVFRTWVNLRWSMLFATYVCVVSLAVVQRHDGTTRSGVGVYVCVVRSWTRITQEKSTKLTLPWIQVRTGRLPGVTTSVSRIRVSSDPPIAMVDTPGILLPNVGSVEMGLNLALTGAVRDEVVGHETLALYLLDLILQSNEIKSLVKIQKFGWYEYRESCWTGISCPIMIINLRDESSRSAVLWKFASLSGGQLVVFRSSDFSISFEEHTTFININMWALRNKFCGANNFVRLYL